MHKRLLSSLAPLVFLFPGLAIAATETVATVTLENGAKVRLNDDFTWQYVILETLPATASETSSPAADKILTAQAMSQAQLLKSTAKAGVNVSLAKTEWDGDGRLGLTFDLDSISSEHYVMIKLDITLYDDSGRKIKTETIKVWKAIFRSPDTYLRRGQHRQSRIFWIEGIDASRWTKQLLSLKIGEMNSRM